MKSHLINASFILILTCWSITVLSQDLVEVPTLEKRVTDQAGLLTSGQIQSLEQQLKTFEDTTGSQVALLIVPSTASETIEQYAIRVVDKWKLGRKDVDDGVLLLIAKNDRKLRIEVGYGLEGAIPDAIAKRIISRIIVPHFRDGDYYLGVEEGLETIMALVSGEDLPMVTSTNQANRKDVTSLFYFIGIVFVIILVVIFKSVLSGKLGNVKSNLIILPLVFLVVWVLVNLSAAFFASFFALIFLNGRGGGGSGGRRSHRSYGGYGWGGGYSSGGGSFGGGFSGGGGFGGGGASGGW